MTTLPNGITRYTGANSFTAEDAAHNIFYAFQKQNDAGCVVMVDAGGGAREVLSIPAGGRPSLDCNPLVGLWAVGNKETPTNQTPARYFIAEYVPFTNDVLWRRINDLEARIAALPPTTTGGVLTLPPQGGVEGGQLTIEGDSGRPSWHIDEFDGRLRIHCSGVVVAEWTIP